MGTLKSSSGPPKFQNVYIGLGRLGAYTLTNFSSDPQWKKKLAWSPLYTCTKHGGYIFKGSILLLFPWWHRCYLKKSWWIAAHVKQSHLCIIVQDELYVQVIILEVICIRQVYGRYMIMTLCTNIDEFSWETGEIWHHQYSPSLLWISPWHSGERMIMIPSTPIGEWRWQECFLDDKWRQYGVGTKWK